MFQTLQTTLAMTAKIAVLAFVFAAFTTQAAGPDPKGGPSAEKPKKAKPKYVEGELLVRFKGEVNDARAEAVHGRLKARKLRQYKSVKGLQHVKLPKGVTVDEAVAAYKKDPNVAYAEPNYRYQLNADPDDALFVYQWGLDNDGQTGGTVDADINMPEAWDVTTGLPIPGDPDIVVAVIDSGIDYTHAELADNMWVNPGEFGKTSNFDDDNNGYVDDIHGYNTVDNNGDPMDDHGHGTHVAGIVAARGDNGKGVAGVSHYAKLVACKFADKNGIADTADAIDCLEYLVVLKASGVNVIASNNSWGGANYSQALFDAIAAQRDDPRLAGEGVLFIASAGNGGTDDIGDDNDLTPIYPASYELSHIIAVAATDEDDALTSYSNFGRYSVHIAAPGDNVLSTVPGFIYDDVFFDDVEGAVLSWTADPPWAVIDTASAEGIGRSWTDSPVGNYDNDLDVALTSDVIDLSAYSANDVYMGFHAWLKLRQNIGFDRLHVEFSGDNGLSWELPNPPFDSLTNSTWEYFSVLVPSSVLTDQFRMRFRLETDATGQLDGVYLDNIGLGIAPAGSYSNVYGLNSGTSMAAPHVSGLAALLKAQNGTRDWAALKNLILAGGEEKPGLTDKTVTGRRLRAWDNIASPRGGSLTCENRVVSKRLQPLEDPVENKVFAAVDLPLDLVALNISCDIPNGNVDVAVNGPAGYSGPAVATLLDTGSPPDQVAGDGIFAGEWVPDAPGTYALTFFGSDVVALEAFTNYRAPEEIASQHHSLSASATDLGLDYLGVANIQSPFAIPFADKPGSVDLYVTGNGYIGISPLSVAAGFPEALPTDALTDVVSPFWDNLDPSLGGGVYWEILGASPDRRLVVEWRDVPHHSSSLCPGTVTFQTVFFEGSSNILFNYTDVSFSGSGICGSGAGGNTSVGVQVHPSTAQQYSYLSPELYGGLGLWWRTAPNSPDKPTAIPIVGGVTTPEDQPVDIQLTGSDVDGDPLFYTVASAPVHGGTLTGTPPNVTYTPAKDYFGPDEFTFTVSDGALTSDPATISIDVDPAINDRPVAQDGTLTTVKNTPNDGVLMASDVDVGDTLTYSIVADGLLGQADVTDAATGAYTYTPDQDVTGTDSFTFVANDGLVDSNIATVTVTIVDPPPPPAAAASSGGGGGGCTVTRHARYDPVLLLLLLVSLMQRLGRRRAKVR